MATGLGPTGGVTLTGIFYKTNAPEAAVPATITRGYTTVAGLTSVASVITASGATTASSFTKTAHGLVTGQAIQFGSLSNTTGISNAVTYYVIKLTADSFAVATTAGNAYGGVNIVLTGTVDSSITTTNQLVNLSGGLTPYAVAAAVLTQADGTVYTGLSAADVLLLGVQQVKLPYVVKQTAVGTNGTVTGGASLATACVAVPSGQWFGYA